MGSPAAPSASPGPVSGESAPQTGSAAASQSAKSLFGVVSPDPSAPILDDGGDGSELRDAEGLEAPDGVDEQGQGEVSDAEREAQEANAEDQEQAEGEEPQAETFTFAGQEFRDQAHAENEFKRALGRLKAQGAQMSQLQQHALAAIQSAQAWQAHVQQQQAGPSGLSNGQTAAGGPAGTPASPTAVELSSLADTLDWGQVDALATEHGPAAALNFTLRKLASALDQAISQRTEPLSQFHQNVEFVRSQTELFERAAEAVDSGGAVLYPELSGELAQEAAPKVVALWKRIMNDFPAMKGSPQAVHFAVLEYRRLYGGKAPAAGRTSTTTQPRPAPRGNGVGAQVLRASREASEAATSVAQGSGGAPLRPRAGPVSDMDVLRRDIERAKARVHPVFGVAR